MSPLPVQPPNGNRPERRGGLPVAPPAAPGRGGEPEQVEAPQVVERPVPVGRGPVLPSGPVAPVSRPVAPRPAPLPARPGSAGGGAAAPRLPLGPSGPVAPVSRPGEVQQPAAPVPVAPVPATSGWGDDSVSEVPAESFEVVDDYVPVPDVELEEYSDSDEDDDGYFDYDEDEDGEYPDSGWGAPVPDPVVEFPAVEVTPVAVPSPVPVVSPGVAPVVDRPVPVGRGYEPRPVLPPRGGVPGGTRPLSPVGVPGLGERVPGVVTPVVVEPEVVVPVDGGGTSSGGGSRGGAMSKEHPTTRSSKAKGNPKARLGEHSKGKKKRRSAGWRMTERDKEIVQFLARYKVATYEQIALYVDMNPANVRHRIPKLEKADLIAVYRGGSRINLVTATAQGMKLVGLTLPTYDPSHGSIRHALALTDLGIVFEKSGKTVVTEREIRAAWQHGQLTPRLAQAAEWHSAPVTFGTSDPNHGLFVVPPPLGKSTGLRIPDMVLAEDLAEDGSPRSVAVEMELTAKEPSRYRAIVSSYNSRGRSQFAAVVYFTPYRDVATAVDKAISEGGASDFMTVKNYEPPTDITYR